MAAVEDNIREVEWRDLADTVLVFVCMDTPYDMWLLILFQDGLFAAFLSAFLIFLIPQLQPNSTDVAMDVLIHISQQLSNSTTPAFEPTAFQVSPSAAAVNMLFFLSLALVLIDAFLAMLVKGWLQEFDRGWRRYTVAHLRAQERERRLQELERWKLHELVGLLPILIQGSLFLFCIGLLVLIFPFHLPSAIVCSLMFLSVVGFYVFTTYVSIVNNHAPFSSPVSRLFARGLAMLQTPHIPITQTFRRIASAISFHSRPLLSSQGQQEEVDTPNEATQPLPSNNRVANVAQPHNPDAVPRSRSSIDPQTHVHVLERLVTATEEAVENIPIFLELLDQPVKDLTLRPRTVEKWKELLHITFRLLGDQSTFSVSTAWTLARTMTICYNHDTADQQLYFTLQNHLGSRETGDEKSRMPLNILFSSYLSFWLRQSDGRDLCRTIAFLEPSDAADAELLWMVNTSDRTMRGRDMYFLEYSVEPLDMYLIFFTAVLTYVSSTEQSRRSNIPLTFAVIYALRAIRSAIDQRDINPIEGLCTLPVTVPTSEPVAMTFCRVDSTDALGLWSQDCIQSVKDLLQWDLTTSVRVLTEFRLSLIAALYIDSTKQAHARSHFADLLNHTNITHLTFLYSGAYDDDKLAIYLYMAVFRKPFEYVHDPLAALERVIGGIIYELFPLQLSGLQVLDIAVKHLHKISAPSLDSLKTLLSYPLASPDPTVFDLRVVGDWILLHLDTLIAPKPYLLLEKVEKLEWSDIPEEVYIAKARLDLYDSLADIGHEADKVSKPDPGLLKVFLWSKDDGVSTRAFKWCLDLFPISQSGTPGDVNSTTVFIPETLGRMWVEHFIQVLCEDYWSFDSSWRLLLSALVPKWTVLPSSWCCDFASALIFSPDMHGLPAYQFLSLGCLSPDERLAFLSFLATLLELIESRLTWPSLTSLENWLAQRSEGLENQGAYIQIQHFLATMKQQLVDETLGFFTELPMESEWLEESLEFFAELPMAGEWMGE